jgi:molybdate transport system substrate-binding protein
VKRLGAFVLCVGLAIAALPARAEAPASLTVFAAASLTDTFTTLGARFEKAHPGVRVRCDFAGSQQLAARLEQGARADVFASADARWMAFASAKDLLAGSSNIFARNSLVLIVPRSNPARIGAVADLRRPGVKLVLCGDAVPVGHYARQVLRNLGASAAAGIPADYATRVLANVVSEEENVRAVVSKVTLGEADAGFCYRSDVNASAQRYVKTIEIPAAANVIAEYPIAVLKDAPRAADAQGFVDFVLSDAGQAVLRGAGFAPAH